MKLTHLINNSLYTELESYVMLTLADLLAVLFVFKGFLFHEVYQLGG